METEGNAAEHRQDVAEALAIADLVRRVAGESGVHVYELEVTGPTHYVCTLWVGEALENLLGGMPDGMDAEAAWEACIHPDDQAAYFATVPELWAGRGSDVEYRLVGFDGVTRWVWQRTRPSRRDGARVIAEGMVSDITERRRAEDALSAARERLRFLAYHDALTGLANRVRFEEELDLAIDRSCREGGAFAVLFIDLDGFKSLNDRHGHAVGDEVLKVVADRLRTLVPQPDAVARLGGDEFLVLGPSGGRVDDVRAATAGLAERIRVELSAALTVGGASIVPRASVGAAIHPVDGDRASGLLVHADHAMYRDKSRAQRPAAA